MFSVVLLADRNSPTNQWLRENPLVLGLIFGVLGIALLYFGITGLKAGKTRGKYGRELSGGAAMVTSIIRLVAGVGLIGTAIYMSIFGAW
ncbi:MAG: hypothetical protein KDA71_19865 [Planctomycetales bacterium]|nr:hypothetical protein [Planctomycetales bacterium]